MPPPRREQGPDGKIHEFPADATDAEVGEAMNSLYPAEAAAPAVPKGSAAAAHARAGEFVKDVAVGAGKKLAETGIRGGKYLRMIPGVDALSNMLPSVEVNTASTNAAQSLGGVVEQVAETWNPARAIAKGGTMLAAKLAPTLAPAIGATASRILPAAVIEGLGGYGMAKAQGASDVAAGVSGGLSATLPTVGQQAVKIAKGLRESSVEDVAKFFHPTTKPLKRVIEKRTPEILERGSEVLGATGRSREAAKEVFLGHMEKAGEAVDEALSQFGSDVIKDAPQRLIKALDSARGEFETVRKVANVATIEPHLRKWVRVAADGSTELAIPLDANKLRQLDKLKEIVQAHGDGMTVDELVGVRRAWDSVAYRRPGTTLETVKTDAQKWAKKMGGDAIRKIISEDKPDMAEVNKVFSFWKDLTDVMTETVTRNTGQSGILQKSVAETGGRMVGAAMGATHGPLGAVSGAVAAGKTAKMLQQVLESPRYASLSAGLKTKIADAIMREDRGLLARYLAEASARIGTLQVPRAFSEAVAQ